MHQIVLLHEIGHDTLHRQECIRIGGFQEFNIFDMQDSRVFKAEVSLPDDEILEYIYKGYDIGHIARAMHSDINLVAMKADALIRRGYDFRRQEYQGNFLK